MSHCDAMVHVSTPLMEMKPHKITDAEERIGKLIAENLVLDGATLQMGKTIQWLKNSSSTYLARERRRAIPLRATTEVTVDVTNSFN